MSQREMSLKARLKNLAREKNISAQVMLQNYMFERMLERLAKSSYRDKFILKGGVLVAYLVGIDNRSTMDIDATVRAFPLDAIKLGTVLSDICAIAVDDDVTIKVVKTSSIRKDDVYGGMRVFLIATYETIRTPFTIDLTVGDVITPKPSWHTIQCLLNEHIEFDVLAYNVETILAEKLETILRRGPLSTRPRDFYDVYILSKTQTYSVELFRQAFWATAEHRQSAVLLHNISQILATISTSNELQDLWQRYRKEYNYANAIEYTDIMIVLHGLVEGISSNY